VELLRPRSNSRDRIRLNVKALGQGQFQCGHYVLQLDSSSAEKMVWDDMRNKGKVSIWERDAISDRSRNGSRSRSPNKRQPNCGCVFMGRVALRCVDHQPLLPPRSVLHDISTPGAWAPPAAASEIVEKQAEINLLSEAYDQTLEDATPAPESKLREAPQASPDGVHEAKASDLQKRPEIQVAREAEIPQASPDALEEAKAELLVKHFGSPAAGKSSEGAPKDPRIRRWLQKIMLPSQEIAPTGGA